MGVICQILLKKTNHGAYRPGQAINGVVKYAIDESTEYQNVTLSLIGKGKCYWSESRSKGHRDNYEGTEELVTDHINILNKRPEDTVVIPAGCYEYPFQFNLPHNLPSSFKDHHSHITYTVMIKFEKPCFFSFTKKFETEVNVLGYVESELPDKPTICGIQKVLFRPFSTKRNVINLTATMAKFLLTPGEAAKVDINVRNDTNVAVTSIRGELVSKTVYTADDDNSKSETVPIRGASFETQSIAKGAVTNMSVVVPTLPQLYSIQHSNVVTKEYKIRITVRLPMPHVNASVDIPVVIGERAGSNDESLGVDVLEDEDPPSYWEVMLETK